jgi:OOP family OmpA-OmpF porin
MSKIATIFVCALLLLPATGSYAEQKDARGCADSPLFTRMPGYWIYACDQKQFDEHAFLIGKDKKIQVEGELWKLTYYPQADAKSKASELQIQRNFENAVLKLGGTVVFSTKGRSTFKLTKDGKEIWVELWAEFTGKHGLLIVQKEAMVQDVVANAEVFSNDIRTTGHAAVYGIYFDTGKSTIKPESEQAIGEIAKLLKADPGLKIFVVGHTDNVGDVDSNIKLSQNRAEAVIQTLVHNHGIVPARLRAHGCGLFAPVMSNDTEEGRAKNRRVELVKQ